MGKVIIYLATLALLASSTTQSLAASLSEALDGLTKTSFGRDSQLAIGDTVDVLDPYSPLERCVGYQEEQIVQDTSGAVQSELTYRFVRDLDQFENTFKLSYNIEASASANFAKIISGESTLKTFGSFENFLKRDAESAMIVIEARALHGRDIVRDYTLRDEFKALIDEGKYSEFRQRCGTHFIRGWNRKSAVAIYIDITNLDREAKLAIENTSSASLSGSIGIGKLGGKAKSSISTTISNTLRLAEKVGTVNARVEAVGGAGIETIARILNSGKLSDPEFMDKLLTAIAESAKDFSLKNSSPDEFILVQFPQLNDQNTEFDEDTYNKLGEIYRALVRVDQRVATYENYKTKDQQLWEKYFRVDSEKVTALRNRLVEMYRSCKSSGQCDGEIPTTIDGLVLDDILKDAELEMRCRHSYPYAEVINGQIAEEFNYLSSISLVLRSDINFLDNLDIDSAEIFVIPPSFEFSKVDFNPTDDQDLRKNEAGDKGSIFAEIDRISVVPSDIATEDEISIDRIREIRKNVAQSVYVMKFHTINGFEIEQTLGRPTVRKCPVYVSK